MVARRQGMEINPENAVAFSGKRNLWSNTVSNWTLAWLFHLIDCGLTWKGYGRNKQLEN